MYIEEIVWLKWYDKYRQIKLHEKIAELDAWKQKHQVRQIIENKQLNPVCPPMQCDRLACIGHEFEWSSTEQADKNG